MARQAQYRDGNSGLNSRLSWFFLGFGRGIAGYLGKQGTSQIEAELANIRSFVGEAFPEKSAQLEAVLGKLGEAVEELEILIE
jgi:hypothetical protein